eukprot:495203-Rhodomonas_salina.1
MAKDHTVAPGATVPKMTPEIKTWCITRLACFSCRQPDATHSAINCQRFANSADSAASTARASSRASSASGFHFVDVDDEDYD